MAETYFTKWHIRVTYVLIEEYVCDGIKPS